MKGQCSVHLGTPPHYLGSLGLLMACQLTLWLPRRVVALLS
jgi:hypothetical protein